MNVLHIQNLDMILPSLCTICDFTNFQSLVYWHASIKTSITKNYGNFPAYGKHPGMGLEFLEISSKMKNTIVLVAW